MRKRGLSFCVLLLASWTFCTASTTYKQETAQVVFDRLVQARGDHSGRPLPTLAFVRNATELARIQKSTIYLGENAYDICTSMGADSLNALAFLLAHELTHYYFEHTWEEEFSKSFVSTTVDDNWLQDEIQADLWGGLLAFTSGYRVSGVIPAFLPKLYEAYGKESDLPGYLSLEERIQMCQQTAAKIDQLVQFFETANYLVALEMYPDAAYYYQLIRELGYRSREVVNNQGVCYILEALTLFRKAEMPYSLPIELDLEARINESRKGGGMTTEHPEQVRLDLIKKAITYFEEAIQLDANYTVAKLNAACAYALLGVAQQTADPDLSEEHFLQAQLFARKATRSKNERVKEDAAVLAALMEAMQGEQATAQEMLLALPQDQPLVSINLEVLEQGIYRAPKPQILPTKDHETIEQLSMDLFLQTAKFDTLITFQAEGIPAQWGFTQQAGSLDHSYIYSHLINQGRYAILHITSEAYPEETKLGIRIGSPRSLVEEQYLHPDREITLAQGSFLHFPNRQIIIQLDQQQKVVGWCLYRMQNRSRG